MDETFPESLVGREAFHVVAMGCKGTKNGALLAKAGEAGFEAFVTADKKMPYQQSMRGRDFSLVVLDIHPNTIVTQVACTPKIETILQEAEPGRVYVVEGPHSKRDRT